MTHIEITFVYEIAIIYPITRGGQKVIGLT